MRLCRFGLAASALSAKLRLMQNFIGTLPHFPTVVPSYRSSLYLLPFLPPTSIGSDCNFIYQLLCDVFQRVSALKASSVAEIGPLSLFICPTTMIDFASMSSSSLRVKCVLMFDDLIISVFEDLHVATVSRS